MTGTLLNVAKPFEGAWKNKAEEWLCRLFPRQIDEGWYAGIHVGRNQDAQVSRFGGFKTTGRSFQNSAIYLEVPDRMIPANLIANDEALRPTFDSRIDPAVEKLAMAQVSKLVGSGMKLEEAQAQVADSILKVGYFDKKTGRYVAEPVVKSVHDSILSGLETPYWNVSRIQKIFRMPLLTGDASFLVSKVGVPNIWADIIQLFTASYEGKARVSAVAHTTGEHNTATGFRSRSGTMISQIINLLIDYESPTPNEQLLAGMEGWLVGQLMSDRDVYADKMLEQLMNSLILNGHEETGFNGLRQIADRDGAIEYYPSDRATAEYMYEQDAISSDEPSNKTVGADLLSMLMHFIADKTEAMHFLPLTVRCLCAPVLYKALHYTMTSKTFNQNSPLSIISTAFESENKIVGTMVTRSDNAVRMAFNIVPDPMLAPNTPFNDTDEDLLIMTFPSLQSSMGDQDDLVMLPMLIDKMVLPVAPAYRDGQVRTALKRIGSLLCPITNTVHIMSGMGSNKRYTPPAPTPSPWVRFRVSGLITLDSPAGAAEGASVQLKQSGQDIGSPVLTDANGAYEITGLLTGVYTLEVSLAGYVTVEIPAFAVNANVAGKDAELEAV
jgi:hypothetical protein